MKDILSKKVFFLGLDAAVFLHYQNKVQLAMTYRQYHILDVGCGMCTIVTYNSQMPSPVLRRRQSPGGERGTCVEYTQFHT